MLFSFLMCVHVDHPHIVDAINSMIHQDFEDDYEILIVANNCTDSLYLKLKEIQKLSDKIVLRRTLIGQLAFNLNYGADVAKGRYLVRMDADDICQPNRLEETRRILLQNDYPDLVCGLAIQINNAGDEIKLLGRPASGREIARMLPYKNPIIHPAAAMKKDSLLKVRGYLGGINCEDLDLWLRMDRMGMNMGIFDFTAIKYRISDYQVKGSRIAYADAAGLRLREALFRGSLNYFIGAIFVCIKFYVTNSKK